MLSPLEKTVKDLQRISSQELILQLSSVVGSQFVSVITETEPRMRKTNNPYNGNVIKRSVQNGLVNFQYDEGVKRRLAKEGKDPNEFESGTSWHEPVKLNGRLTPFCRHKKTGDLYFRYQLHNSRSQFFNKNTGDEISKDALTPFLYDSDSYKNQGLDEPLMIITPKLSSIKEITFGGKRFILNA